LEEVGLAEAHPSLPLKVLHGILDESSDSESPTSFVGLSNWLLDPAKLNRSVNLFKDSIAESELLEIASTICSSAAVPKSLEAKLHALAKTYWQLASSTSQSGEFAKFATMFGIRDYFAACHRIVAEQAVTSDTIAQIFGSLIRIDQ
jgi:hypothetical protein